MSRNTTKTAAAASVAAAMTTPAQLERLGEHLRKLRLLKSGERLEALLQDAAAQELPYAEFLEQVLGEEVAAKTSMNIAMRTAMARFPFVKPLETFEFAYQPSIDAKQVHALASGHFIEHGDNVIVLGPPGVGKTHLAVSLGLKAIGAGYRVLFTAAASLIEKLTKAHAEGRLEEKFKLYTAPRLLIIDEIGYLPIDRVGANLFFQLISRRYERGPMILTSNQSFGAWGEVFGDRVIATAILDRLLHHAVTMNIRGNSYRLKDKLKPGWSAHTTTTLNRVGKFERPRMGKIRRPLTLSGPGLPLLRFSASPRHRGLAPCHWPLPRQCHPRESRLLLARASSTEQAARIGDQTGGRVFLFLYTDNLARDYQSYKSKGVIFVREPREESYGTIAVFKDLYGNLWDLPQPSAPQPNADA